LGGENAEGEQIKEFLIRFLEKQRKNEFDKFYAGSSKDLRDLLSAVSEEEPSLAPRDGLQQEQDEWEELKNHIIATIKNQKRFDYARLMHELSVLIADTSSPLARCLEVILAILLSLNTAKYKFDAMSPLRMLLEAQVTKERMIMLVGLAWGLVLSNAKTRKLVGDFQRNIEEYEEAIDGLSQEELSKLHEFTQEVWENLHRSAASSK